MGAQDDIHKEFTYDLKASGMEDRDIPKRQTFSWVFYNSPALKKVGISGLKRNFCRCNTCCEIEAEIQNALKAHSADDLRVAKAKRQNHYLEEKSDKFHYYSQRNISRDATGDKLTVIIDKMDSAKNKIPYFARNPKDVDEPLKRTLTSKVVGVIIHGRPDAQYFNAAGHHQSVDSNLNLECLRRALVHYCKSAPLRRKLYVQFDNASDNKNKNCMGFLAWMVLMGYIEEAELSMMMPGHTHEDIDAAFRVIAEHFYQLGMILTVDDFMAQLRAAWSGGKHDENSIVEPVDVVFDYKAWFDGAVYDVGEPTLVRADTHAQVKGITSARYFLIRKRADGNVCFWYKPQPAHPWLYPTKKDASGEPMYTVKDGERCYDIPCPDGIEIFHREFARGPSEAAPKHAMFPEGLLDVKDCMMAIREIHSKIPAMTGTSFLPPWEQLLSTYPTTLDMVPQEMRPAWQMPPLQGPAIEMPKHISEKLKEFNETIHYTNPIAGQILRNAQVQTNLDEQQQDALAQKVEVGDKVLIQPDWTDVDEETKKAMDTPLWLAKITDASDKDVVNVAWYLTFANRDPKPRMDGKWSLACKCQPFHKFDILVCGRRRNHGLWVDTVDRASIKAVDVCLTQEGKFTKAAICGVAGLLDEVDVPLAWKPVLEAAKANARAKKLKGKGVQKSSATRRM